MISQIIKNIDRDLAALEKGEARTWAQLAMLLDQVDSSGYWRTSSGSFTEWIKAVSPSLKLKEASLWRYLTAARYYQELRKTLTEKNVDIPQLDELYVNVSPENIEILSKLSRVTSDDIFLRISKQVVAGTITRAELRETWVAYRPALLGKTARGKGVEVPKINRADKKQYSSMLEAQVFTTLSANKSEWTGIKSPERYQLFMHVSPEFPADACQKFKFDAVAALRTKKSAHLILHGIDIKGSSLLGDEGTHNKWMLQTQYCDFLWVATIGDVLQCLNVIPSHVGILVACNNFIQVIRPAQQTQHSGHLSGELAKGLVL